MGKHDFERPKLKPGVRVRVKSAGAIAATLDADGRLDGMPFMPEMIPFCGQVFRVQRPLNRIYIENRSIRALRDVVLLEDARCNGSAHGACDRQCNTFWKTAWLEPVDAAPDAATGALRLPDLAPCQGEASVLLGATGDLTKWNLGQYLQDLRSGGCRLADELRMVRIMLTKRYGWLWGAWPKKHAHPNPTPVPPPLNLQPGMEVEIRSRAEIEALLDGHWRTNRLLFTEDMWRYCGRRCRVLQRVERFVDETTGRRCKLHDVVLLDGITCDGRYFRGCPRNCLWFWHAAWLKAV